jgi:hypothetical protein
VEKPNPYETSDSSPDSNSDGSQPLKLSNNLVAVASRRLRMRKRGRDDEQLPPLHPLDLHVVPHMPGMNNMAGASNTAGASNIASASNTTGACGMLLVLAFQGASNIVGARASAGADNNTGANGSAGANQPFPTAYPANLRDNLRILEIKANMDAFGTPPLPETALCSSNTVAMWRKRYKQQVDQI